MDKELTWREKFAIRILLVVAGMCLTDFRVQQKIDDVVKSLNGAER